MTNRIIRLYASYDRVAEIYGHIFPCDNDNVAIRAFGNALFESDQKSDMSQNPQHFELFYLGEYDYSEGRLIPSGDRKRKPIATGDQLIVQMRKSASTLPTPQVA